MGRFWIEDSFIREGIQKHKLSIIATLVYFGLACHCNGKASTFIGHRRLAKCLNINKDTVTKAMKELEASDYIRRLKGLNGKPSETILATVRNEKGLPSYGVGHKEVFKEVIKESSKTIEKEINGRKYRVAVQQP